MAQPAGGLSKSMIRLPNGRGVVWQAIAPNGERSGITRQVRRTVRAAKPAAARQGPRDAAAKQEYLAQVAQVKQARAQARARGIAPTSSQADDLAASQRDQRYRRSHDQRVQNARERRVRRAEAGYRKQIDADYQAVRFTDYQKLMAATMPATAVGTGIYAHRLGKALSDKDRATVAGAASGAAGAYSAAALGGYGAKKLLARRRRDALANDPEYRKTYRREWDKFRRQEGFHSLKDLKDNTARADVMSRYPKTLKDWRGQRALAFKNKTVPYVAAVAVPAAVGGVVARSRVNKALKPTGNTRKALGRIAEGTLVGGMGGFISNQLPQNQRQSKLAPHNLLAEPKRERVSKGKQIWAKNEAEAVALRERFPDADVQVRTKPKKPTAPKAVQQANKKANAAARKARNSMPPPPSSPPLKPRPESLLFRMSKIKVPGGRATAGALLVAGGAASGSYAAHPIRKDRRPAVEAAVGGAGAYGSYMGAGYALNNMTRTVGRNDPRSKQLMREHTKAVQERHGYRDKITSASPKAVKDDFFRNIPNGVKFAGTRRILARTHGSGTYGRMAIPVLAAGAAAPLAYHQVKKDSQYQYLAPNIEYQVEYGIPEFRRNPVSPLQMLAASNIAAEGYRKVQTRNPFGRKGRQDKGFQLLTQGASMAVQPLGIGRMQ